MTRHVPESWASADVLAYLEQRIVNCRRVAGANPPEAERATIIRQNIEVIVADLRAGLHDGLGAIADPRASEGGS